MTTLVLPFVFAGVGLKTPTARLDANFEAIADWLNSHGFSVGLIGSRPPPDSVGAIYVATDQNLLWYMADGTAWHPVGRAGDGQIDVDPVTGVVRLFGAVAGADAQDVVVCGLATGLPTTSPPGVATLYVADTQGVDGRAAWHQRTEDQWVHPLDRVLFRLGGTPPVTVANLAAETVLLSQTLAPQTLIRAGVDALRPRGLELALALDVLNNTGATRTCTLRVRYGGAVSLAGAVGITVVLTLATSATRRKGTLRYRLDATTDVLQAYAQMLALWDAAPTQALTLTATGVDATLAHLLEITAQHSLASTALDVRLFSATVSLV